MKRTSLLLTLWLLPALALGQSYIRNDTPTTMYPQNGSMGAAAAVDQYGQQKVVISGGTGSSVTVTEVTPGVAATDLGKAEDAVHTSGDVGVEALAVQRNTAASSGANGDYVTINEDANGKVWVNSEVTSVVPGVAATNLGKAEDAALANGDTGVAGLYMRSDTASAQTTTTGDYTVPVANSFGSPLVDWNSDFRQSAVTSPIKVRDVTSNVADAGLAIMCINHGSTPGAALTDTNLDQSPFACDSQGGLFVDIDSAVQQSAARGILKNEDVGSSNADAGVAPMVQFQSTPTQSAGSTADYSFVQNDDTGRVYVNDYGAGVGQFFTACSSAATDTTQTQIKAGVASNRMYVTDIACKNTAAVSSGILFQDNNTTVWVGDVGSQSTTLGTDGNYNYQLRTPIRGSVNTAFNFTMGTTATSTICCISGYTSTT